MSNDDPSSSHRILVIDDNPDIHEDFRKILCENRANSSSLEAMEAVIFGQLPSLGSQFVFEVDSAFQGEPGLARVYHALQEERPYEIAFLDVRMPPGWDGIEVAPKLWVADPYLQIVICTAYSDYTWEEMFAKIGSSDRMFVLKKPFDRVEVLQLAHSLSRKRELERQNRRKLARLDRFQEQLRNLEETGERFRTEIIRLKKSP